MFDVGILGHLQITITINLTPSYPAMQKEVATGMEKF